jgi:hypothetical protein
MLAREPESAKRCLPRGYWISPSFAHGSHCRQLAWNSAFAASSVGALGCQWNSERPKIERINCGRKLSSCENEQSALNSGFLQTRKRLRKS